MKYSLNFIFWKKEYDLSTTSSETIWKSKLPSKKLFSLKHIYIVLNSLEPYFKQRSDSFYPRGTIPRLRKVSFQHFNLQYCPNRFHLHFKTSQSQRVEEKKVNISCLYFLLFSISVYLVTKKNIITFSINIYG